MSRLCVLLLVLGIAAPAPALAQDEEPDLLGDEDLFDGLEDSNAPNEDTKRIDDADDLGADEDPTDDPGALDKAEDDLLDGGDAAPAEGVDNASTYRAYEAKVRDYELEQEVEAWERYLERFPNSIFRDRIEERIEKLMDRLYGQDIIEDNTDEPVDARLAEIELQRPMTLENINPRTHFNIGFEFGLPSYLNLFASEEWAFSRKFSVHGGVRNRYTGFNIEAGVHYAVVKSERTNTIVTLIGDLHFNTNPAFLGVRPAVGVGKIFGERVHLQGQFGFDLELRGPVGVRYQGGANVTVMAAPVLAVFAEVNTSLKHVIDKDTKAYHFTTASVGLKFMPKIGKLKQGDLEIGAGGTLPVTHQYWAYHFGSFMGQATYYHNN